MCDDQDGCLADPAVLVSCGAHPECRGCADLEEEWRGGALVPPEWCAASQARHGMLLRAAKGNGGNAED